RSPFCSFLSLSSSPLYLLKRRIISPIARRGPGVTPPLSSQLIFIRILVVDPSKLATRLQSFLKTGLARGSWCGPVLTWHSQHGVSTLFLEKARVSEWVIPCTSEFGVPLQTVNMVLPALSS